MLFRERGHLACRELSFVHRKVTVISMPVSRSSSEVLPNLIFSMKGFHVFFWGGRAFSEHHPESIKFQRIQGFWHRIGPPNARICSWNSLPSRQNCCAASSMGRRLAQNIHACFGAAGMGLALASRPWCGFTMFQQHQSEPLENHRNILEDYWTTIG